MTSARGQHSKNMAENIRGRSRTKKNQTEEGLCRPGSRIHMADWLSWFPKANHWFMMSQRCRVIIELNVDVLFNVTPTSSSFSSFRRELSAIESFRLSTTYQWAFQSVTSTRQSRQVKYSNEECEVVKSIIFHESSWANCLKNMYLVIGSMAPHEEKKLEYKLVTNDVHRNYNAQLNGFYFDISQVWMEAIIFIRKMFYLNREKCPSPLDYKLIRLLLTFIVLIASIVLIYANSLHDSVYFSHLRYFFF